MKDPILLIAAGHQRHTPALQRAFDLAQAADVPVHVCLLAYDALIERSDAAVLSDQPRAAQQEFLDERRVWVDELVARWNRDGLRATGEVVWARVAHEAILDLALRVKPALIVKDVGQEHVLRRITYTALDWKLLRLAPAPLMLVHALSGGLPRRILAAVETLPPEAAPINALILREALKLGDWADAEVRVGHVFPYLPAYPAAAVPAMDGVYMESRDADREAFDTFAAEHQVPPDCRHWLEGGPAQRLAELAREQAIDLLVLGANHHSRLDRLVLGSTAETLLFQAPCDVLLVKREEFAAELTRALTEKRAA